jgi:hypothetical protein
MTIQQARKRVREIRPDLSNFSVVAVRPNRCGLGHSVVTEGGGSIDLVSGAYTPPPQDPAERFGGDERRRG